MDDKFKSSYSGVMSLDYDERASGLTKTSKQACDGYTVYCSIKSENEINLLNIEGEIVHKWKPMVTPDFAEMLPNGNLMVLGAVLDSGLSESIRPSTLLELDWDGNVVWEYVNRKHNLHHDFARLKNGNTLILQGGPIPKIHSSRVIGGVSGTDNTPGKAIRLALNSKGRQEQSGGQGSGGQGSLSRYETLRWKYAMFRMNSNMIGDSFVEITPDGRKVWEWHVYKNLNKKTNPICPLCHRKEWTHTNSCEPIWDDTAILTTFRHTHGLYIIDRKSGDIIWEYHEGLGHPHDPTMLENGNILLFDNGEHSSLPPNSRVIEINPETEKIEWSYTDKTFFSPIAGGAQRLWNGNTLICDSCHGRIFEVTNDGKKVWEYINPAYSPDNNISKLLGRDVMTNWVYRANRYPKSHIAFRDRGIKLR